MNHTTATAADLAVDHDFIQWVKYPTHESNVYWKKFADQHPEKAKDLAEARHLVLLLSQDEADNQSYDLDMQQVWGNLQEVLREERDGGDSGGRVVSFWRSNTRAWLSVAAASLVLLISFFVFFGLQREQPVTYATSYGEKRTIQLSDNSVIVLNANSIVTIPEKWGNDKPREVMLQGEAFFSVTHQANNQQFTVTTSKGTKINVLGTEFNVYDRDHENKVVLESGKVVLSVARQGQTEQLEMEPGDLVSITADAGITRRQVDPSLYTAWQQDKIYFDDYTLREVAAVLKAQYGYHVEFGSASLSEQRLTAFLEVKSVDDILSTLAETFELKITKQEKTIHISSL